MTIEFKCWIKKSKLGYIGGITLYENEIKLWSIHSGIHRITESDAIKDAVKLKSLQ